MGPLYVFGTGVAIVAATAGIGWIYEKTRKRMEHPTLGPVTLYGHTWNGTRDSVRFELPGDRQGPDAEAEERFEKLWSRLEEIKSRVRPEAIHEYDDIKENCDDPEHLELVDRMASATQKSPLGFDTFWRLIRISLQELGEDAPQWGWQLEFDVAWDVEHTRSAYLDLEEQILAYGLTCAVFLP